MIRPNVFKVKRSAVLKTEDVSAQMRELHTVLTQMVRNEEVMRQKKVWIPVSEALIDRMQSAMKTATTRLRNRVDRLSDETEVFLDSLRVNLKVVKDMELPITVQGYDAEVTSEVIPADTLKTYLTACQQLISQLKGFDRMILAEDNAVITNRMRAFVDLLKYIDVTCRHDSATMSQMFADAQDPKMIQGSLVECGYTAQTINVINKTLSFIRDTTSKSDNQLEKVATLLQKYTNDIIAELTSEKKDAPDTDRAAAINRLIIVLGRIEFLATIVMPNLSAAMSLMSSTCVYVVRAAKEPAATDEDPDTIPE